MGGPGAPGDLEDGAATQAWLAAGDDRAADVTGRFFFHRQEQDAPADAARVERQEALLAHCAGLSGQQLG
jgi:hypothetical protein